MSSTASEDQPVDLTNLRRMLPPTLGAFMEQVAPVKGPGADVLTARLYELAGEAQALHACDVCQRPIVQVAPLVTRLLEAWQLTTESDIAQPLEDAIRNAPIEQGDILSPNYCSEHAQITSE